MESFDELLAVLNHLSISPNSLEDACYVKKVGHDKNNIPLYCCILCDNAGNLYNESLKQHLAQPAHLLRVQKFKVSLNQAIRVLWNLDSCRKQGTFERLDKLGRTIWTDTVHTCLFHHITLKPGHEYSLPEAKDLLTRYEYLEPQALLALAVWKAECIQQMPLDGIDFFRAQHWISSGWKALKKEHRNSNAMTIVVSSVRPFLPVKR
jgi:hypothetical protein